MTKTATDRAFWDASGVLLLALDQRGAAAARMLRRRTGAVVVWWGTRVEVACALARLVREEALPAPSRLLVDRRLDAILREASETAPTDWVRDRARDLVLAHPLRAADALQLAAALAWARDRPRDRVFVTFDERLAQVARAVGFDVRP